MIILAFLICAPFLCNAQAKGSLAYKKIRDWKKATTTERYEVAKGYSDALNKQAGITLVTPMDLKNCIDEATKGLPQTDDITIQDMAMLCMEKIIGLKE